MRVAEVFSGNWGVFDGELLIASGFRSNSDAWNWIDKNTDEGREATDRFNRIRSAFADR